MVREGDKVYVIKQYAVEEEDNTDQPRCLALVGFIMCTLFISDILVVVTDYTLETSNINVFNVYLNFILSIIPSYFQHSIKICLYVLL